MAEDVGRPIAAGNTQMAFTNQMLNSRRQIRTRKNPLDKCTIVSVFPQEIDEIKYTIEPGRFHIGAGTLEEPAILVVGSSSWWKDFDAEQPMLEIPNSSVEVAESVIKDYCNGLVGCNMQDLMPGLFFILGPFNVMEVKLKYQNELKKAHEKQLNWYKLLVRIADSLWARTNGNPLVIADQMRLAAKSLHYNDKPWLQDFQAARMEPCKFCGNMRNPLFPICPSCKTIDPIHTLAKDIKQAL